MTRVLSLLAAVVLALALSLVLLGCERLARVLEPTVQAIEVSEPFVLACSEERQLDCPDGAAGEQCIEAERAYLDVIARAFEAVRVVWCELAPGDSRCVPAKESP